MTEFLTQIIAILKELKIKPVIYGSFGVSAYLGNFKDFADLDILIPDEFITDRWEEFRKLFESHGFNLVEEKEHEFEQDGKKVGVASMEILLRDKIITNYSELVQYLDLDIDAFTLIPEDFLKAYKFSAQDGYRLNTRGKKDEDIIEKLEIYIRNRDLI